TTCWTRSSTRSIRAGPTRPRSRSTAGPMAGGGGAGGGGGAPAGGLLAGGVGGRPAPQHAGGAIPPAWDARGRGGVRRGGMAAALYRRVGNPETDKEFLWSRSPLSRARDIRIPLLIAQGANDPRVKQAESEQIVAALKDAGIDYEYMLFPDEGHGFAKPENR